MSLPRHLSPAWPVQPQNESGNDNGSNPKDTANVSEKDKKPAIQSTVQPRICSMTKSTTPVDRCDPTQSHVRSDQSEVNEKAAASEKTTGDLAPISSQLPLKRRASHPSPPPPAKKPCSKLSYGAPCHLSTTRLPKDWPDRKFLDIDLTLHNSSRTTRITPHIGDIFDAPPSTLLIHACNTQGYWGAGIALAFRKRYPKAYKIYRSHCINTNNDPVPTGSALLIQPVDKSSHWIGCLFTSAKVGRLRDPEEEILKNTVTALVGLLQLVQEVNHVNGNAGSEEHGGRVGCVRMCKINSGKFGVPWEKTREAVESKLALLEWKREIEVWEL